MENNKIRCHFSIIFEKAGSFLVFWFILAWNWMDDIIKLFTSPTFNQKAFQHLLPICIGLTLLLVLILGYQFLVWRKTFIYLEGETFVVERNTLNRKKNTFSIASIANINLEQNLFERLIGTSRLKLDTDSFSTADSTDVSIVLSTPKATALKESLLSLMNNTTSKSETSTPSLKATPKAALASTKDVFSHCFFNISTGTLFFSLLIIIGLPLALHFGHLSFWELISENNSGFYKRILAIALLVITYGYAFVKQLLSFYHFCCYRQGNEIMIQYGFFHKQEFTIPLERINAVQILQPPLARLTGRMQAQLICVGIGDDDAEKPQLTLSMKEDLFFAHMQEILPEFSTESIKEVHNLPKNTGIAYFFSCLSFFLLFQAGFWITVSFLNLRTSGKLFLWICYGFGNIFIILYQLFHYHSMGTGLGQQQLTIHNGVFQKRIWMIPYRKIQFSTFQQNPICRSLGITRGKIHILASLGNNIISLPYVNLKDMNISKTKLLD